MSKVKMQDFIVEGKEIFIGLEDSKKTWKVAVRCGKMLVHQTIMPAKYHHLISYIRNKYPSCKAKLIYEAGFHGFWLHDLLVKDGVCCVVVPPHTVTEEKTNRVKTDKRDARRLAQNLENGDYKTCHVPDRERREDRQVSRTLEDVQNTIVATRNRIWKMLDFHGITIQFAGNFPTKKDIRKLRELAVAEMIATSLKSYLDLLDFLWDQQQQLRNLLRQMTKKQRYQKTFEIIHGVPGIGWFTAIRLVLEWGEDLSRFISRRHIASFVGLTGSEHSTGETVRRGHLSGLGHKRSRTWLIECTWVALRKDPVLLDKYNRVLRNTGSKKKAIVAAARKMVGRILRCVVSGQPYTVGLVAAGCEMACQ
jgi:transposase